jgi:hypothetical protein
LGQTTDSLYTLQPQQSDRAVKIRLISIDGQEGTVAETEVSHEPQKCKSSKPVETGFATNPVETSFASNPVETSFSLPNPTQQVDHPNGVTDSGTILIVTSSVLMSIFVLTIVVAIVVKRSEICLAIKMLRRKKEEDDIIQVEENVTMSHQNNRFAFYLNQLDEEDSKSMALKNGLNDKLAFFV